MPGKNSCRREKNVWKHPISCPLSCQPGAILAALLLLSALSCTTSESLTEPERALPYRNWYPVADSLAADEQIEAWLGNWRTTWQRQAGERIAVAEGAFCYGRPESPLGNLVADLIRYRASLEMKKFVHLSVLPHDLIRTTLPEGPVTAGTLYELVPGGETLVILEMSGAAIADLADEVAAEGGVPLSGLRMTLAGGRATGVLLNTGSPRPGETYLVATTSRGASRDGFASLKQPQARHEIPLLIRDLLAESLASRRSVGPSTDQRIRTR